MSETWMTYQDLAERLGVTPEAARQRAIRGRWRRQNGNDGKTLVLVEPDNLTQPPRKRTPEPQADEQPNEPAVDPRTVEALESHIATLKTEMERLHTQAEGYRADLERERERGNKATAATIETAARLIEAERKLSEKSLEALNATHKAMMHAAERDRLRLELDAATSRFAKDAERTRWWKRLVS